MTNLGWFSLTKQIEFSREHSTWGYKIKSRGRTLGGKGAAMKDDGEVKIKSSAVYYSLYYLCIILIPSL